MESLSTLLKSLNSFRNLYSAVLRCVGNDTKNASVISKVIGLTVDSTRHRIRNPHLWRVCEIEKLAIHYDLPISACTKLQDMFPLLWSFLSQLPDGQSRQIKKTCHLRIKGVDKRLDGNSSGAEIELIHQGLNNWVVGGYSRQISAEF